jgi:hypothetical protein
MYQLRKKKILPILLPSMVEAENFLHHPRIETSHTAITLTYREFGKSPCTRLQCIVIAHARLMN